jgi:phospholipase C
MKKATHDPKRRRVVAGLAAGLGSLALPGGARAALPKPADSGIDHVIVMMMENRSFDHFLGWVPGANGVQAGLAYPDRAGVLQQTYPMLAGHASPWQGCGSADPNHGYEAGRIHMQGGWLKTDPTQLGDKLPLGYYRREDLPFYSGVADDWTVCDRYHTAIMAGTWPNRFYMHAGDNDFRDGDGIERVSKLPTVWDALIARNKIGRYYYGNLPFVGLWRKPKYMTISRPLEVFFEDCLRGDLPSVAFVDPIYESGAPNPLSNDDHPHSDVRAGQLLLNRVYDAVRTSPAWPRTLLIINYDEWGGFFDHVTPPIVTPSTRDAQVTGNDGRLGFRVPCALIGPRVRRGYVHKGLLHPNSILNFISWRFGLPRLGSRSTLSGNLGNALDWDNPPNLSSRGYSVPLGVFGADCERYGGYPQVDLPGESLPTLSTASQDTHVRQLRGLHDLAKSMGFWIGPVVFPS